MALNAGDETVASDTMSREIYDELNTAFGSLTGSDDDSRKKAAAAIAKGVVKHIKAHADLVVTSSMSGMQRYDDGGGLTDTAAPSGEKVFLGAID